MTTLTVAFDAGLPQARWGPLFHVFRLERGDVVLRWHPVDFPVRGHSVLERADVAVLVQPPQEAGLAGLALDAAAMVVVMATGHPLASHDELTVADVLNAPFLGGADLDPEWCAFWTLDAQRRAPPTRTDDSVENMQQALAVIAAGRAIATAPAWAASGLPHPGIVALPLTDGPQVTTQLVWREGDDNPAVDALVSLATAWTGGDRGNGSAPR
jgi:DNA-binding transcriptional LysR family regulator